jgi:CubicO group peptidase (beta-lactamase class C family)
MRRKNTSVAPSVHCKKPALKPNKIVRFTTYPNLIFPSMKSLSTRKSLLFFLLAASVVAPGSFRLYAQETWARIDAFLDGKHLRNEFRGVVLIVRNDSTLFSKGYGAANEETKVPNSPQTVFRLGSVTKQFTAAAILQLQEQGKLSVQDRLCQYVQNCPAAWKDITLHQLLTHSSGVFNYTDLPGFGVHSREPHTVAQLLTRFRDKELQFTPGSRSAYSNSGYLLLGHVIERVSGKPYDAYLQENIFGRWPSSTPGTKRKATACQPGAGLRERPAGHGASRPRAHVGSLRRRRTVFNARRPQTLEPVAARRQGPLPAVVAGHDHAHQDGFGYGLVIDEYQNRKRIHHGGRINGFENYVSYYPDEKVYIIVMSNQARIGADAINQELASLWFEKKAKDSE